MAKFRLRCLEYVGQGGMQLVQKRRMRPLRLVL
jgi:hypothetical protein